MHTETIDQKVIKLIRRQLNIKKITPVNNQQQLATLGADILDIVEMVIDLEEVFDFAVEDIEIDQLITVQDVIDMVGCHTSTHD